MNDITNIDFSNLLDKKSSFLLLVYTNFCGTCDSAKRMLEVISQMELVSIYYLNGNMCTGLLSEYQISSIPCFLIFNDGKLIDKFYAFYSVPYIYNIIKRIF